MIRTETQRARKGNQKICHTSFDQVLVMFEEDTNALSANAIEVAMPLGLYTSCEVSAPCGLCSNEGIIGLLDVPNTFLIRTACTPDSSGSPAAFLNISFPTMPSSRVGSVESMEFSMELSSEVPGTAADWPSDITVSVNGMDIGTWTSPAISATSAASTRPIGGS